MSAATTALGADGEVDADAVATIVTALPEVASLSGAGAVPVATYLPGRRVSGVRSDDARVTVAVVGARGVSVPAIASAVRAALGPRVGQRRVDVRVEDVLVDGDAAQD